MATRLNKKVLVITVLSISVVVGGLGMAWLCIGKSSFDNTKRSLLGLFHKR